MTFVDFIWGAPRYRATALGHPGAVVALSILFMAAGPLIAAGVLWQLPLIVGPSHPFAFNPGHPPGTSLLMLAALVSQISIVVLVLLAAWFPGAFGSLLLKKPEEGWGACLHALGVMAVLVAVLNAVAFTVARPEVERDLAQMLRMVHADGLPVIALAIGLGAPLSEELLFRGYMISGMAATRIGFWPSALVTTLLWTGLHSTYTWVGLTEVFCIGVYFSWVLWRTGSLLPGLVCHAVYNSGLLILFRFWPF
ncbi:MAG: CPBP family intramembrane glutamic endopeptidase [Hyphomicrobiaceae bacterium]